MVTMTFVTETSNKATSAMMENNIVAMLNAGCRSGIHPTAVVAEGVIVGAGVQVGPYVVLEAGVILGDRVKIEAGAFIGEGTRVGSGTVIGSQTALREFTTVGKGTLIESAVVIGSDGFGFATDNAGHQYKVPQMGIVEIGDEVVIGAGTTIDRATMGKTVIGNRCRIGSHVMIGHNVKLAADVVVGSGSGIGGTAVIDEGVQIGIRCGIIGHARIGAGARIEDFTGVTKSVPEGHVLVGHPNMTPEEYAAQQHSLAELPGLLQRVAALEKKIPQKALLL